MGTLTFFIFSILCAGLQHEILAGGAGSKNSGTASSSSTSSPTSSPVASSTPPRSPRYQILHDGTSVTGYVFRGSETPERLQNMRLVHTENPTHVAMTKNGEILGPALAINCYFVITRHKFVRRGCEVSTRVGETLKPHEISEPTRHGKLVLLRMRDPILLGNGHSESEALSKQGYTPEEIQWADDYVKNYIARVLPPESRSGRGEQD